MEYDEWMVRFSIRLRGHWPNASLVDILKIARRLYDGSQPFDPEVAADTVYNDWPDELLDAMSLR